MSDPNGRVRRVRFTVRGRGRFPRRWAIRERAYVASLFDRENVGREGLRSVTLQTYVGEDDDIQRVPNRDRWREHGWEVTHVYAPESIPLTSVPEEQRP